MTELAWPVAPPAFDWAPPRAELTEVWVAVVVVQYQVSRKDVPVTTTLSSFQALFAPASVETVTSARVVAAAAGEAECRAALADWKASHPGTGGEEVVAVVPFGQGAGGAEHAPGAPSALCIGCGAPVALGFRCDRCAREHHRACREVDPDWGKEEQAT